MVFVLSPPSWPSDLGVRMFRMFHGFDPRVAGEIFSRQWCLWCKPSIKCQTVRSLVVTTERRTTSDTLGVEDVKSEYFFSVNFVDFLALFTNGDEIRGACPRPYTAFTGNRPGK